MSIVELIPDHQQTAHREFTLWCELIGLGPDGQPLPKGERLSLYELIQRALRAKGRLGEYAKRELYGANSTQQRTQIGVQLCTLWLHRLLICHQLERKLIRIHGGDTSYRFFSDQNMDSWDELGIFFLNILPQPFMFRQTAYSYVPPLDIPLFQEHELERLLPMAELGELEKKGDKLLPQILNLLAQQDESIIDNYHLGAPVPEEHAQVLAANLLDLWCDPEMTSDHPAPKVCDPLMRNADLLQAMVKSWMRRLYGKQPEAYQVTAGPGGFNRHVPQKIQQLHTEYYREMAAFADQQLFGVAPDEVSLAWVKMKLWSTLLEAVPFNAESSYELFFPLPKFRHKLCFGPALVSQYRIGSQMQEMLKGNRVRFGLYCSAIGMYQDAQSEKEREEARGMLDDMQKNFRTRVQASHPDFQRLKRLEKALLMKENPLFLEQFDPETEAKNQLQKQQLQGQIERLKARLEGELRVHRTFEWRFHFPELLHPKQASFLGFDLILLHPKEPKLPEEEIYLNQALSLVSHICNLNGKIGTFLPDHFTRKKVFQKGRKVVFEQLGLIDQSYLDGQGFEELCTGKLRFVLQKGKVSLEI